MDGAIPAWMILGPTGAGKTPLGEYLSRHGMGKRRCHHFDFGHELRRVARRHWWLRPYSAAEVELVKDVLHRGALLEDDQFPLALKVLHQFVQRHRVKPRHLLLLNGLPRHQGQVEALLPHVHFERAIHLTCGFDTVRLRLQLDSGGDRAGRTDDHAALVESKLATYAQRTLPLLDWCAAHEVPVTELPVDVSAAASDVAARLGRLLT